jgi:hypothetical protein
MKKLGRNAGKLETINLFSLLQDEEGGTLYDPQNQQSFLTQVDSGLAKALSSESTLHGIRAQAMFEGMVANLGSAKLIKQEDAGECYYDGDDISLPDFRVVTKSNETMLIETKSHFHSDPFKRYRIRQDDLERLKRYAAVSATPLRLAVYWARLNVWTLNKPGSFSQDGKYAELDFKKAMSLSEMATLGDFTVGTKFPLTLRLWADMKKARSKDDDGRVLMHVGSVEVSCGGEPIVDRVERNIVLYLMMYGKWEYDGGRVELDEDGLPVAMVHSSSPDEPLNVGEEFEMIGSLSSLYSSLYNSLTLKDGVVERLRVKDPASIAPVIPLKFEKKSLPLWRFVLQPNAEE